MAEIGLLHPGEMGAAIGSALVDRGHNVSWASPGRSSASADRARAAGLTDLGSLSTVLERCDVVLSVCPPHAAASLAAEVAGFRGHFVDANAVSPATAAAIAERATGAGATYTDGGIIGPPPARPGTTRLYLSGPAAPDVAELFAGSRVEAIALPGEPFSASALKMAFSAWNKGAQALLLAAQALARAGGVEDALAAEWDRADGPAAHAPAHAGGQAARKGWRWSGEMEEIAAAMEAAGLPPGFHAAAADIYARAPADPGAAADAATLARVVDALLAGPAGGALA